MWVTGEEFKGKWCTLQVVVKLRGGLGNQLFQYLSGLEISKEMNASLVIDGRALPDLQQTNHQGISIFPEEISSFSHHGIILKSKSRSKKTQMISNYLRSRLDFLDRIIGDHLGKLWLKTGRISGDKTFSRKDFPKKSKKLIINNPMFNHEDFNYLTNGSLQQLLDIRNASEWYLDLMREANFSRPISIHIRLGDHYLLSKSIDTDYFSRAIEFVKSKFTGSPIWVFSDDPDLAREILSEIKTSFRFIEQPKNSRPIETLALMATTKCLIMSNSSFSWWAANLGIYLGNSAIVNRKWVEMDRVSRFMAFDNQKLYKI